MESGPQEKKNQFQSEIKEIQPVSGPSETKPAPNSKTAFMMHLGTASIALINFNWIISKILSFAKMQIGTP